MFSLIGVAGFLRLFAWVAAVAAAATFAVAHLVFGSMPSDPWPVIHSIASAIGSGVTVAAALVWIGQTPLFPFACLKTPLGKLFPCIEGKWEGELKSNIVQIAERDDELRGKVSAQPTAVTIFIKARLLTLSMNLQSRPLTSRGPYLESETSMMAVQKFGTDQHLQLTYVFEGHARDHLPTDSEMHYGAAVLHMTEKDGNQILDGLYWTNRNWKSARNTAGTVTFHRRKPK